MNYLLVQITSFADFNSFLLDAHFNVLPMLNVSPRLMSFSLKMLDFLQLLRLSWAQPKDQ